jgi:hypothetical protein
MDDRIDLTPLDPRDDAPRFDRLVSGLVADAVAARADRPQAVVPLLLLTRWSRPLLAAAATIAIIAAGSLLRPPERIPGTESLLAALGIPAPVAAWAERGEVPSVNELIAGVAAGNTGVSR